jgi:hypothetical protein
MNAIATSAISSFTMLLVSLPESYRIEKMRIQLQWAYDQEVKTMAEMVNPLKHKGKPFSAQISRFVKAGGSQWTADFFMKDLSRLSKPEYD